MKKKVSVLIPTKNRATSLVEMLSSLVDQSFRNFEVVIVDGGSTDATEQVANEFSKKLQIKFAVQNGGLIKQENKGLEIAEGEIFIRTDDDAKASPFWLEEIVKIFDSCEDVGGVTGPTITLNKDSRDLFLFQGKFKNGNYFWKMIGRLYYEYILENGIMQICRFFKSGAFSLGSNYQHALELQGIIEVDMHDCCTMACRRDILNKIGGFDKVYGGVGDYNESDVSFKIRDQGYKILFNPKAYIWHNTSKSGVFNVRSSSYGRMKNFIYFYFRHFQPKTLDQKLRFLAYLFFQNGYYFYMFLQTGQWRQLGSIPATVVGLMKNFALGGKNSRVEIKKDGIRNSIANEK